MDTPNLLTRKAESLTLYKRNAGFIAKLKNTSRNKV